MIQQRKVDPMFDRMLTMGASDLHLHEGQLPKVRVHGTMRPLSEFPVLEKSSIATLMRELCGDRWGQFESNHDLDFACEFGSKARFRANFKKHYGGYGAVFRVIPSRVLTIDELKAPEVLKQFSEIQSGLVLVT